MLCFPTHAFAHVLPFHAFVPSTATYGTAVLCQPCVGVSTQLGRRIHSLPPSPGLGPRHSPALESARLLSVRAQPPEGRAVSASPLQPHGSPAGVGRMRAGPGGTFRLLGENREQNGAPLGAGGGLPVGGGLGAG